VDDIAQRVEAFDEANGGGVGWCEVKDACYVHLPATGAPIARLKPIGTALRGAPAE
jgi:hypothetical protein